jgi:hypothetical protein
MAERDQEIEHPRDKTSRDFLLAEYQALVQLDGARNERLDRYLTLFLTLAGAPWALYILILKPPASTVDFAALPLPVACVFLGTGLLGALVTMMFVQVRFNIILYMRAMNDIRGYFKEAGNIRSALRLPFSGKVPHYHEKGNYIQIAVIGMSLVNAAYIGFGSFSLLTGYPSSRGWICILGFVLIVTLHIAYYSHEAKRREKSDQGKGDLMFH